jgi:hypothetical protein
MKKILNRLTESWLIKRYPHVLSFLFLAAIIGVQFREVIILGYVLDGNIDRYQCLYPFHVMAQAAWKQGLIPQWNPWIFCGSSFLFTTQNQLFYPLMWLVYALPEGFLPYGISAVVYIHIVLAGCFCYLIIVSLTGRRLVALSFATGYSLSSPLVMNAANELFSVYFMLLPLIIYILLTFSQRCWVRNACYLAVSYSLLFANGITNVVLYVAALTIAFSIYQQLIDRKQSRKRHIIATNCFGLCLGVGAAAVKLLPFFYDLRHYLSSKASFDQFLETAWTPYEALLRLVMPHFFGSAVYPTTANLLMSDWLHRAVPGNMNNYETFLVFAGTPTALCALCAFCLLWTRAAVFWKLAVLLTVLTVCGGILAYAHYHATGRSLIHFGRIAMLMPLYTCVLAALGWTHFTKSYTNLRKATIFLFVLCGAIVVVAWLTSLRIDRLMDGSSLNWPYHRDSLFSFAVMAVLLLGALVGGQVMYGRVDRRWMDGFLLLIVSMEMTSVASIDRNSSRLFLSSTDKLVPSTNLPPLPLEITEERKFRMLSLEPGTDGSKAVHLGAYTMSGLDQGSPGDISELYWYPEVPQRLEARSAAPRNPQSAERVLQLTSTLAVLTPSGVFSVNNALPRWSLLTEFEIINDRRAAIARVLDPDFRPQDAVVIDRGPDKPIAKSKLKGTIDLVEETSDRLKFNVNTPTNALLLLTDTYYPGWAASVNGARAPILRANSTFRAVAVPEGQSTVVFQFVHPRWRLALTVSIISVMAIASLFVCSLATGCRSS